VVDADQGFCAPTSLIQTIGRAARHINGTAILYADRMTDSMKGDRGDRRRAKQVAFNAEHGIEPQSIVKDVASPLLAMANLDYYGPGGERPRLRERDEGEPGDEASLNRLIAELEKRMRAAAKALEFEEAALRSHPRLRRQQIK
jgi:excinuclease ABC subunit B